MSSNRIFTFSKCLIWQFCYLCTFHYGTRVNSKLQECEGIFFYPKKRVFMTHFTDMSHSLPDFIIHFVDKQHVLPDFMTHFADMSCLTWLHDKLCIWHLDIWHLTWLHDTHYWHVTCLAWLHDTMLTHILPGFMMHIAEIWHVSHDYDTFCWHMTCLTWFHDTLCWHLMSHLTMTHCWNVTRLTWWLDTLWPCRHGEGMHCWYACMATLCTH